MINGIVNIDGKMIGERRSRVTCWSLMREILFFLHKSKQTSQYDKLRWINWKSLQFIGNEVCN